MIRLLLLLSFILINCTNNWSQKSLSIGEATSLAQYYNFQFYPDSALSIIKSVPVKNLSGVNSNEYTALKMQEAYAHIWRIDYNSYDSLRQLIINGNDNSNVADTLRFKLLDAVLCAVQKKFVIGDSTIRAVLEEYNKVCKEDHPDSLIWKPYQAFYSHMGLYDFNNAPSNYTNAINILNEAYPQKINLAYALETLLAIYYNYQADVTNGLLRINRSIKDCLESPKCKERLFPVMTVWKTDFLFFADSIDLALKTIKEGYKEASTPYQIAKTSDMTGEAYAKLGVVDSVYIYYEQARSLLWQIFGPDPDYISTSDCYGRSLNIIGDQETMMEIHHELEKLPKQQYPTSYGGNIHIINILYKEYMSKGEFDKALEYYNTWLSRNRFRGEKLKGWELPDSKRIKFHGADPIMLMKKAVLGLKKYNSDPVNNLHVLSSSKEICVLSDSILNSLIQLNTNSNTRLNLIKGFSQFNNTFIDIYHEVYNASKSKTDLEDLLYAIDRSHDLDLWISLNNNKISSNYKALNHLLLEQDSILRQLAKVNKSDALLRNELSDSLHNIEILIKKFTKTKADLIDRSNYNFSNVDLISENEEILMYHYDDKHLLRLYYDGVEWVISKQSLTEDLSAYIQSFRQKVTQSFLPCESCSFNEIVSLDPDLNKLKSLLIPKDFNPSNHLNLILDKHLSLLPFDLLLMDSDAILDYSIQYSLNSMNYLSKNTDQISNKQYILKSNFQTDTRSFLDYNQYRGDYLGKLKFAKVEQQTIAKYLDDAISINCVSGHQLETFFNDADIIHLITHAKQSFRSQDKSYIAVNKTEDCTEIDFIEHSELDYMQTEARLVVLSACETGIGEYISGEGIHSFSKTLVGNGAKSVVSSLWQVNDRSTSMIMGYFYEYLSKGLSKSQALIQAKQDYLDSVDEEFQHPYYWAGLQLFGSNDAIQFNVSSNHNYLNSVFVLAAVLFLIVLLKMKYF